VFTLLLKVGNAFTTYVDLRAQKSENVWPAAYACDFAIVSCEVSMVITFWQSYLRQNSREVGETRAMPQQSAVM
jgi:hypothetical protein